MNLCLLSLVSRMSRVCDSRFRKASALSASASLPRYLLENIVRKDGLSTSSMDGGPTYDLKYSSNTRGLAAASKAVCSMDAASSNIAHARVSSASGTKESGVLRPYCRTRYLAMARLSDNTKGGSKVSSWMNGTAAEGLRR